MNLGIITDPAVGGTFVTWSLYWLAGATQYWSHRDAGYRSVPLDPLTGNNAHGFRPCQPTSWPQVNDLLQDLDARVHDPVHAIYFHNFNEVHGPKGSTQQAISALQQRVAKAVVVTGGQDSGRFNTAMKARVLTPKIMSPELRNLSDDEQHQDWVTTFFAKDLAVWKEQGLTAIWDYREFLALNLRPHQYPTVLPMIDWTPGGTWLLPCRELWTVWDPRPLLAWADITVDATRLAHWHEIYQRWQQQIRPRVLFVSIFDDIVNAIIENRYIDLLRLDLDVVQEAQIQQTLIYQHDLNLRTWQLERFEHTQQLHQLLEQNTHLTGKRDN